MELNKCCVLFFVLFFSFEAYGTNFGNGQGTCPPKIVRPMFLAGFRQCVSSALKSNRRSNPEIGMNTTEILTYRGYTVSEHETISEDGYIILTVRVLGGQGSPPREGKEPILLHHGIATSSGSWLIQPGSRNIVAMLIDAGYDVWLLNARGTIPSRKHVHLNPNVDLKYWDFSLDEMGTKDLPPLINLILKMTGYSKIYMICYSLGCGNYLVGLSEMVELNDKIETTIMFAPVGHVGHADGALRMLSTSLHIPGVYERAFSLLRGRIDFDSKLFSKAFGFPPERFCNFPAIRCSLCTNFVFALLGADSSQMDYENLPFALTHLHDVVPLRVMKHFSQNMHNCSYVRKYDFGRKLNLLRYGSLEPPEYVPMRVSVPTYIFYGEADNVTPEVDVHRTVAIMSPKAVKLVKKVAWSGFTHIDFITAKDADKLVYRHALQILATQRIKKS